MRLKERTLNTYDLQIEHLKHRAKVEMINHENKMKGYYGEQLLDEVMKHVPFNGIELCDIRLVHHDVERQFDTILFLNHQILIIDAKYYTGNIEVTSNYLIVNGKPYEHPNVQANRSIHFLEKFLDHHFNEVPAIDAITVFTNIKSAYAISDSSCVTLKHLPQTIHEKQSNIKTYQPKPIAQFLIEKHKNISKYQKPLVLTQYDIKKGFRCPQCNALDCIHFDNTLAHCEQCGHIDTKTTFFETLINDYKSIHITSAASLKQINALAGVTRRNTALERYIRKHKKPSTKRGTYLL